MAEHDSPPLPTSGELPYQQLTAYFTRKLGCATLAKEIVHEAYIRLRRLPALFAVANPPAYLFRITANLAIDHLRKEKRRRTYLSPEPIPQELAADVSTPETMLDQKRRLAIVQAAVDELPPKCRQVFILRKFEGMEQAEIAQHLGISRNMVEKHLRKALLHCRARLEQSLK